MGAKAVVFGPKEKVTEGCHTNLGEVSELLSSEKRQ